MPIDTELHQSPRMSAGVFLAATFVLAWSGVVVEALHLAGRDIPYPGFNPALISQFAPSLVAVAMVLHKAGRAGLARFLRNALPKRATASMLRLAAIPIAMAVASIAVLVALGTEAPTFPEFPAIALPGVLLLFIVAGTIAGGLSEELGWRGLLLPTLQGRMTALAASVAIAVIWTVWHLEPTILARLFDEGGGPFLRDVAADMGERLSFTVPMTIVFTSLYNRSGGHLFIPIAAHGISNGIASTAMLSWIEIPTVIGVWAWAFIWWAIAIAVMRWGGAHHLNPFEPRNATVVAASQDRIIGTSAASV